MVVGDVCGGAVGSGRSPGLQTAAVKSPSTVCCHTSREGSEVAMLQLFSKSSGVGRGCGRVCGRSTRLHFQLPLPKTSPLANSEDTYISRHWVSDCHSTCEITIKQEIHGLTQLVVAHHTCCTIWYPSPLATARYRSVVNAAWSRCDTAYQEVHWVISTLDLRRHSSPVN